MVSFCCSQVAVLAAYKISWSIHDPFRMYTKIIMYFSLLPFLPGEAINRLRKFFPTADAETVISVQQASVNEGKAVKRLLELGFPLRKVPIPRA